MTGLDVVYCRFSQYRGWYMGGVEATPMTGVASEQGLLKAVTEVSGEGVYNLMKFESKFDNSCRLIYFFKIYKAV